MSIKKKIERLRDLLRGSDDFNIDYPTILDKLELPKGTKARLLANKEAEKLLRKILEEDLEVTEDIKLKLLKFTGYGGMGGMDNDEYYTPKEVAKGAWQLLDTKDGDRILDPSTGTGIFSATANKDVNIIGCDLNPVSGAIANIVNDNSKIASGTSFEEYSAGIAPNSLDGVITNVPFGNRDTQSRSIDKEHSNITKLEDYFILKSLKLLKYGKKAVFLTTSSTAQRASRKDMRREFSRYGAFVGGIRLPSAMFADVGTEQVVDILVFQKHPKNIIDAIEKDAIDWQSWNDALENTHTKEFIDGKYFDLNPQNIIGKFTSREQLIKEAEENGETLHHHKQKDTVTLPDGVTIEEVKANFAKYLKRFVNDIDYSLVSFAKEIVSDSTEVKEELQNAIEIIDNDLELLREGKVKGLAKPKEFLEALNTIKESGHNSYSYHDKKLLYAREIACNLSPASFFNELFFGKITSDDIDINASVAKKWLNKKPKSHPLNGIVVEAYNKLASYDFDSKEFVSDISDKIDSTKYPTFADKTPEDGFQEKYSIEQFSKEELERSDTIVGFDGYVYKDEDFLIYNQGLSYKELEENYSKLEAPQQFTKEEWDKIKENTLKRIKEDNTKVVDYQTYTPPLSSLESIFGFDIYLDLKRDLKSLNSIKEAIKQTAYKEFSKIDEVKGYEEEVFRQATNYSAYDNFIEHLLDGANLRVMDKDVWLPSAVTKDLNGVQEKRLFNRIRSIIIESFTKYTPALQEFINNKVHSDPKLEQMLKDYLETHRTIKFNYETSDGELIELSGYVKQDWLQKARHYQNSDTRKYAKEQQGVLAYDTGLGKTLASTLLAMQILRSGGKRVMYVVPNAILGKIKSDIEKTLTKKMLDEKVLFVDSKNAKDFAKLKTDSKIQFIVTAGSTLINSFKLKDETVNKLWGRSSKEENTNSGAEYPSNNLREWIKKYPTYSKNAFLYFEDSGVDSIIIDEAHHYKNAVASVSSGVKGLTSTTTNDAVVMLTFVEYIKGIKRGDMRGCILTTATPATSSPTELETMLLFSTDRRGLRSQGIFSAEDFEKRYFTIERKSVLKTDGVSFVDKKVLTGITNLPSLRMAGLDLFKYRMAEEEEAVARAKGQTISVKPPSEEKTVVVKSDDNALYDDLVGANKLLGATARAFNSGSLEITEDKKWEILFAKEYGEIFGFINKAMKMAISNEFALDYTKIRIAKQGATKEDILSAVGKVKVTYKIPSIATVKGFTVYDQKEVKIDLADYYDTEYYRVKASSFPSLVRPLFEDGYLYFPSTDYATIKSVLSKLKSAKLIDKEPFKAEDYPKLSAVVENIKKEVERHPHAKQIIYLTALGTHHIMEHLIKANIKECKKVWHFSGAVQKKADDRLKVQEEFNDFGDMGIMIFGKAGEVGVDFNKNVCAVHLVDIGQTPDARHQAKGRAVRQGNKIDKVAVYNYMAQSGFDFFLTDLVKNKSNWIEAVKKENTINTEFTDDTIEYITTQAELKYAHLDIPIEDKIQKYIDSINEEKAEFRQTVKNALIDEMINRTKMFKVNYINELGHYSKDSKVKIAKLIKNTLGWSSRSDTARELLSEFKSQYNGASTFPSYIKSYISDDNILSLIKYNNIVEEYEDIKGDKEEIKGVLQDAFRVEQGSEIKAIYDFIKQTKNDKEAKHFYLNKIKIFEKILDGKHLLDYILDKLEVIAGNFATIQDNYINREEKHLSLVEQTYKAIGIKDMSLEEFKENFSKLEFDANINTYTIPKKDKNNLIAKVDENYIVIKYGADSYLITKKGYDDARYPLRDGKEVGSIEILKQQYPKFSKALDKFSAEILN
jgi:predicted RNA methylase